MISDLTNELTMVRDRLKQMEEERNSLENETLSLNDRQTQIIKQLETKLDILNNEKFSEINALNKKLSEMSELNKSEMEPLVRQHLPIETKQKMVISWLMENQLSTAV